MSAATAALEGKKQPKAPNMTLDEFLSKAGALPATINGVPMMVEVKRFESGNYGWFLNGKMAIKVGNEVLTTQIGLNMTVCGSRYAG